MQYDYRSRFGEGKVIGFRQSSCSWLLTHSIIIHPSIRVGLVFNALNIPYNDCSTFVNHPSTRPSFPDVYLLIILVGAVYMKSILLFSQTNVALTTGWITMLCENALKPILITTPGILSQNPTSVLHKHVWNQTNSAPLCQGHPTSYSVTCQYQSRSSRRSRDYRCHHAKTKPPGITSRVS